MARKSRETIWKEKLADVSSCPADIFDIVAPDEALLMTLSAVEALDGKACADILSAISLHTSEEECLGNIRTHGNDAIVYLIGKAIESEDRSAVGFALKLICLTGIGLEYAQKIGAYFDRDYELTQELMSLYTMCVIEFAAEGYSYTKLLPYLTKLSTTDHRDVWLYAFSMTRDGGQANSLACDMSDEIGIPVLPTLPSFGSISNQGELDRSSALRSVDNCVELSRKYFMLPWAEHWLRCAYEICDIYLHRDMTPMARDAVKLCESRFFDRKRSLHTFVWAKYATLCDGLDNHEWEQLYALSEMHSSLASFGYTMPEEMNDEVNRQLLREAIYTSYVEEKKIYLSAQVFGFPIIHARNRYSLAATLKGHTKRGRKHYWEAVISIKSPEEPDEVIEIAPLAVSKTNNVSTRGGATLPYDKTSSQVLCTSEISIGGVAAPLEVDLILDIAYISSVKCGEGSICLKPLTVKDGFIIYNAQFYLY